MDEGSDSSSSSSEGEGGGSVQPLQQWQNVYQRNSNGVDIGGAENGVPMEEQNGLDNEDVTNSRKEDISNDEGSEGKCTKGNGLMEEDTNGNGSNVEGSKSVEMGGTSERLALPDKRKEIETVEDNDLPRKRRRLIRGVIVQYLEDFVVFMKLPASRGFKKCPFFVTGCTASFRTEFDLRSHLFECFYGVFQLCKTGMCDFGSGQIFRSVNLFFDHTSIMHSCSSTNGTEETGIPLVIKRKFFNVNHNGYHLELFRRFQFDVDGEEVRVLVGLVVQRIAMNDFRVLFTPIAYKDVGNPIHHLIRVELAIHGQDGAPIFPISGPEFSADNPSSTIVCSAFNSPKDFIDACVQMDAVVSYDSRDLLAQSFAMRNLYVTFKAVTVDLKFTSFRCVVERDEAEFPPVPYSLTWNELGVHTKILATMDDSEKRCPSEISGILIPQLQGQNDVMVECIDANGVLNAVRTTILDHILRNGIRPNNPTRTPMAWIIYPSALLMRHFFTEWKKYATAIGITVYSLEDHFPEVQNHLKRVGCDILITNPCALQSCIQQADPRFMDELTREVKFVFLAEHHKNCCPEQRQQLQFCLDQISAEDNSTITIAHVQCMHPEIQKYSREMISVQYQEEPSAMFTRGWNFFSIGPDPAEYVAGLVMEVITDSGFRDRINRTIDLIAGRGNMRWLVVGMDNHIVETLGKEIDAQLQDTSRVKYLTQEKEIMMNYCFWDEFLLRSDSIMIGPYFLLESPESHSLDGLIMLTEPLYDAEKVRIRKIVELPDGGQKPVISFKRRSTNVQ